MSALFRCLCSRSLLGTTYRKHLNLINNVVIDGLIQCNLYFALCFMRLFWSPLSLFVVNILKSMIRISITIIIATMSLSYRSAVSSNMALWGQNTLLTLSLGKSCGACGHWIYSSNILRNWDSICGLFVGFMLTTKYTADLLRVKACTNYLFRRSAATSLYVNICTEDQLANRVNCRQSQRVNY